MARQKKSKLNSEFSVTADENYIINSVTKPNLKLKFNFTGFQKQYSKFSSYEKPMSGNTYFNRPNICEFFCYSSNKISILAGNLNSGLNYLITTVLLPLQSRRLEVFAPLIWKTWVCIALWRHTVALWRHAVNLTLTVCNSWLLCSVLWKITHTQIREMHRVQLLYHHNGVKYFLLEEFSIKQFHQFLMLF